MSDASSAEPLGQNLIKIISNACFSLFVFSVLIFTVIAITYQPPDPWLESSKALTRVFTDFENATFTQDNSIANTGEDIVSIAPSPLPLTFERIDQLENSQPNLTSNCDDASRPINCSDPRVLISIERFNLRVFSSINFFEYGKPAFGSKQNECDVAWKFRSKKEKSWRIYRDFRRFKLRIEENCTFKVVKAGRWHSGKYAKPRSVGKGLPGIPTGSSLTNATVTVIEEGINDTIPIVGSESSFRKGKYLYYSRGGDYCKGMNHYLWSFLCALGEAQYLNRTFVMDMSICLSGSYNPSKKDEEDKDFRNYFDLEHLKQSAKITEEGEFIKEWKGWDRTHKRNKIPVRRVASYKVTPMQLKKDKSTVIWRQFDGPEPENYWYRVCEGSTSKFVQRPWLDLWKSKRLMNIVSEISGRLDWDFDAVHVVRGEKAEKKELWPNLDSDTSPDGLLEKLKQMIRPWRKLYIATNEPFYNYFDRLRSQFKIYLLDDFKELWAVNSEWYNETRLLNGGQPVEFDGYMRVAVDTEVLYRAKIRVETFNNLTRDCKDGINTC